MKELLLAFAMNFALSIFTFAAGALNLSGAIAALAVGMTVLVLGGWDWFYIMLSFLLISIIATFFKGDIKKRVNREKFEKSGGRDWKQVLANSFFPLVFSLFNYFAPSNLWFFAFLGAMATAAADTWSTELGVLSPEKAISIKTMKKVETGESGGISFLGTTAGIIAASLIGSTAVLLRLINSKIVVFNAFILAVAIFSGLLGDLVDSYIGATVQANYYCPKCKKTTEKKIHSCGTKTKLIRGYKFVNNDIVNLSACGIGALVAVLFALIV